MCWDLFSSFSVASFWEELNEELMAFLEIDVQTGFG